MIRPNGFTLVELLVAMTAGSLILLSLSWSVSSLSRQLTVTEDEVRLQRFEALAPILTNLLEQAQPPGTDRVGFVGDEDSLSTTVAPPMSAGPVGPLRMTLKAAPSGASQGLFVSFKPLEPNRPFSTVAATDRLLVDGYERISFAYLAEADRGTPRLPRLISISAYEKSGAIRRISAAPRIDTDGRCRFDPISMTCRY